MTLIRFEQQNLWSIDGSVEQVMTDIRCACSGGFVAAFGIEWNGPKFSHNELPASWIEAYNAGGLLVADPLAHWATLTTGMAQWSEIRHSQNSKFFELAEKHGMVHGVVFSSRDKAGRNFLTCVNVDRDFEEHELEALNTCFFRLNRLFQRSLKDA